MIFNLGTDSNGFGFGGTGKKSNARQFDSYGEVKLHAILISTLKFRYNKLIERYLKFENKFMIRTILLLAIWL